MVEVWVPEEYSGSTGRKSDILRQNKGLLLAFKHDVVTSFRCYDADRRELFFPSWRFRSRVPRRDPASLTLSRVSCSCRGSATITVTAAPSWSHGSSLPWTRAVVARGGGRLGFEEGMGT